MGMITPALLGAQGKFSLLSQDERNAFRYTITLDHLREYQKRLEIIRHNSENNEFEKVRNFRISYWINILCIDFQIINFTRPEGGRHISFIRQQLITQ
jgi:hypothetical protein